ncbi:hypothetical protein [Pedococcus sp. 5OH_020]|uniref:hypothetical protein n=1 Tax=Pedococcus sp. 5OH_020 TaxID=2989814 RepID=UPI0022E9ECA8|nr:hypothetical protein [Pedococcus sp. 5OH_020]
MSRKLLGAAVAALVGSALAMVPFASVATASAKGGAAPGPASDARFGTAGSVTPTYGARTIPHWSFTYTDPTNGVKYTATMVGSDPRKGGSTTVKTEIIPLEFTFVAAGQDMSAVSKLYGYDAKAQDWDADPTTGSPNDVAKTLSSPIFAANTYPGDLGGDTGQYGDVFMRAQFGKIGSGYHVKLANTTVLPKQRFAVPASQGVAYQRVSGAVAGIVEGQWFSTKLQQLMGSLQIDPTTVPIFLTHNVLLFDGHDNYTNCCTLGYHGAAMPLGHGAGQANGQGNNPVQTFIYAAYTTPNTYTGFSPTTSPTRGIADIHGLSHEVAEWLDDPFVDNAVQPWLTPTAPQYGCTGVLETGDPVVGVWFPLAGNPDSAANNVWHPEDEVNANWFARNGTTPLGLSSWDGRYTFMGPRTIGIGGAYTGFASVAKGC